MSDARSKPHSGSSMQWNGKGWQRNGLGHWDGIQSMKGSAAGNGTIYSLLPRPRPRHTNTKAPLGLARQITSVARVSSPHHPWSFVVSRVVNYDLSLWQLTHLGRSADKDSADSLLRLSHIQRRKRQRIDFCVRRPPRCGRRDVSDVRESPR